MTTNKNGRKYLIDEGIFIPAYEETRAEYGPTNDDTARKIIFLVMELTDEGIPFRRAKSIAIAKKKIWPEYRSQFHSLVTKYFQRVATKRENKKRKGLYRSSTVLVTPMMSTEWGKKQ